MVLEYVKSSKRKDLLVFVGYIFEKNYTKNGKAYWKCLKYISISVLEEHTLKMMQL